MNRMVQGRMGIRILVPLLMCELFLAIVTCCHKVVEEISRRYHGSIAIINYITAKGNSSSSFPRRHERVDNEWM
jgi:hypothetical protein